MSREDKIKEWREACKNRDAILGMTIGCLLCFPLGLLLGVWWPEVDPMWWQTLFLLAALSPFLGPIALFWACRAWWLRDSL